MIHVPLAALAVIVGRLSVASLLMRRSVGSLCFVSSVFGRGQSTSCRAYFMARPAC